MELSNISEIEKATEFSKRETFRVGMALLFIVGIMIYASLHSPPNGGILMVVAAMVGGYMAMNIGANDVANNVGPAVGSRALTLTGALIIAAIFEASGALIAGGEVVGTIKDGIIDPSRIADGRTFVWLMLAALLAGALWLNIATASGAPVSTTHSIVGGVLGAGVAAGGVEIANWSKMGEIAASWIISPLLGGLIAAGLLYLIKRTITYKSDMLAAARQMVPLLVALMAWAFITYLLLKGLKQIWKMEFWVAAVIGFALAAVTYFAVRARLARATDTLPNDKNSVNNFFTIPLIFAAALLSFAHGANDVANAVGPLAAITDAFSSGAVASKAPIPLWVMVVGAIGISLGLALYGPKLIRTVGSEITELDKTRAFCIALSAALTVIVASQLGLPVSSTHIAVGGVFGVGFLREYLKVNYADMIAEIKHHHESLDPETVNAFLAEFEGAPIEEKGMMLKQLKERSAKANLSNQERKSLRKVYRQELVKRSHLLRIAAAWIITVPISALMGALTFYTLRGMLMP